jgi:peptidoglycan/LPS O-acetylase OafA/YrhL
VHRRVMTRDLEHRKSASGREEPSAGFFEREAPLGRRRQLDSVRGIAVALVVGFHAFNWPRNGGTVGVGIFFVLSGFLITSLLIEEFAETGGIAFGAFYGRRALRLFPLLYAMLIGVALISIAVVNHRQLADYLGSVAACALYAGNLYGLVSRTHTLAPPVAHLWTLAVEEQFYIAWPVILAALLTRFVKRYTAVLRTIAIFGGAAIVLRAAALASGHTIWTLPTTHADALLTGCAIAIWRFSGGMRWWATSPEVWKWVSVAALVGLLLAVVSPYTSAAIGLGSGYTAIEVCGGLLVLASLATAGPLTAVLSLRPLAYLGTISYGLYLIHTGIAVATRTVNLGVPRWLFSAGIIALSVALSAVSRKYFEAYFLSMRTGRSHSGVDRTRPATVHSVVAPSPSTNW